MFIILSILEIGSECMRFTKKRLRRAPRVDLEQEPIKLNHYIGNHKNWLIFIHQNNARHAKTLTKMQPKGNQPPLEP